MKDFGYWILNGHTPIHTSDVREWGEWYKKARTDNLKRVALDEKDGIRVSTVFLGLDLQWGDGPPLLFETMIFGGPHDEYMDRYSTWEEAEEGHKRALKLAYEQDIQSEMGTSEGTSEGKTSS